MLREIKNGHLRPRFLGFTVTSVGASPTKSTGGFDLGTLSGSTGQVTCPFARAFSRAPVVVSCKGSDVAANGGAYIQTNPTSTSVIVGTHSGGAGAADDGTAYCLALGHDSSDTTLYRPAGFNVHAAWDRSRIMGIKVTTTTPTLDIAPRGATISKTATGDVTITFPSSFGSTAIVPVATPILGTRAEIEVTTVAINSVRIKRYVSGTLTDGAFYLLVYGADGSATYQTKLEPLDNDQRFPRMLGFRITYSGGVPAITTGTGDATLTDTGTGDVLVTLNNPFKREPIVVATPTSAGLCTVKAAASSSAFSILGFNAAGAAADLTDVSCIVLGWDDATVY